jgi:hypothetical protein
VPFGEIRLLPHGTSPNVPTKRVPAPKLSASSDAAWRGLYLLIYSIPMTIVVAAKYFHPAHPHYFRAFLQENAHAHRKSMTYDVDT